VMLRTLRRLIRLALLAGSAYAAYTMWAKRSAGAPAAEPAWPPLQTSQSDDEPTGVAEPHFVQISEEQGTADGSDSRVGDATGRWLAPVEGACPPGYPVKANASSRIYHVPGGRDYERTVPERCYATNADAEADGYRQAQA
jgi:hypothetical protein